MPAPANHSKKPTRASYARMLAHITIGLGISTGAAFVSGSTHGQSCDRCAGLKSQSCGCESESRAGPKQSYCKCIAKPSLGEQLLSHFDKVGDRIEARANPPRNGGQCDQDARSRYNHSPTCGCESPQGPNRSAIGSIGDKQINTPVHNDPLVKTPDAPVLDPTMQRFLIEKRKSTPELNSLSDPPPAWDPYLKPPQKTNPKTPAESKLPDVLVDPFKDDVSFRGTRQEMEGILLTSDRQLSTNQQRFAHSDRVADQESTPIRPKKPSRLSPIKLGGPNLQFEATESASSHGSQVVPSNFTKESLGKAIVRKEMPKRYSDDMPLVPRIRVPTKR